MLCSALVAGGAVAESAIEWSIVGPETLEGVAIELERGSAGFARLERLAGAPSAGPPIRVELHAEDSAVASATPQWIAGFAQGALDRVVLFPERVPRYPNGSLDEVLRHELMHVYIARATAGRSVPRWFNEGLSTVGATSWGLGDRTRLTWALVFRGRRELVELDPLFRDGATAPAAYAISAAFVRDLVRRYGSGVAAHLLAEVRRGASFDVAFRTATGTTVERAADRFWSTHSLFYRWIPILSSSLTLWIAITGLFLLAAGRRRQRDARVRELWDAEDRARAELAEAARDRDDWIH